MRHPLVVTRHLARHVCGVCGMGTPAGAAALPGLTPCQAQGKVTGKVTGKVKASLCYCYLLVLVMNAWELVGLQEAACYGTYGVSLAASVPWVSALVYQPGD